MFNHIIAYTDNIDESNELELHTINNFNKLNKFVGEISVDFQTTYSKDGSEFKVHSHGMIDGVYYDATAISDDMYKSVDLMVSKLESQFRTAKGKRISIDRKIDTHHENDLTSGDDNFS